LGDVDDLDASVPLAALAEDAAELLAHLLHGRVVADVEEDGAEDLRGGAGPVLERLADELAEGDDEAALVPDADDDVGAGDLLDASPLVVDDDDVVQADR